MTIADGTLALFTFCNTVRFVAYVPQIIRLVRDRSGAEAISFGTWGLFLVSHASAMAYALVNNEDWLMASMFLGNAVGCGAILLIAAWKRSRHGSSKRRLEQCIDMTGVGGSAAIHASPTFEQRRHPRKPMERQDDTHQRECPA